MRMGIPSLYAGRHTDVIDGCPKAKAMDMLIRTMSPDVLVTDEIGGPEDGEAIMRASVSGVRVIASAHAGSTGEALRKSWLRPLMTGGCFDTAVLINRDGGGRTYTAVPTGEIKPRGS